MSSPRRSRTWSTTRSNTVPDGGEVRVSFERIEDPVACREKLQGIRSPKAMISLERHRPGRGHPQGAYPAFDRALLPGRCGAVAGAGRDRTRPGHREAHREPPPRQPRHRVRARKRQHFHAVPAGRGLKQPVSWALRHGSVIHGKHSRHWRDLNCRPAGGGPLARRVMPGVHKSVTKR